MECKRETFCANIISIYEIIFRRNFEKALYSFLPVLLWLIPITIQIPNSIQVSQLIPMKCLTRDWTTACKLGNNVALVVFIWMFFSGMWSTFLTFLCQCIFFSSEYSLCNRCTIILIWKKKKSFGANLPT